MLAVIADPAPLFSVAEHLSHDADCAHSRRRHHRLKSEASLLSDLERRELIGYLLALGRERTPGYWDKLAARLEDRDSAHWAREEQLDRVLGLDRPEA